SRSFGDYEESNLRVGLNAFRQRPGARRRNLFRRANENRRCTGGHTSVPGETKSQVEGPVDSPGKVPRKRSAHLMCGTPFWGAAAAAASAYFAYSSFGRLHSADLHWQHDWWTILTWLVWVVVIAGVFTETRCWRERLLFGAL